MADKFHLANISDGPFSFHIFQSTPLFMKFWSKLLQGHALDAIAVSKSPDAKKACTAKDADEFLRTTLLAAVEKKQTGQGGLVVTTRDSEKVKSFSAGGGAGASPRDAVHHAGFKK